MSNSRLLGIAVVLLAGLIAAGLILSSPGESDAPAEGFVPYDSPAKQAQNDELNKSDIPKPAPAPDPTPSLLASGPSGALAKPVTAPLDENREGEVLNAWGPKDSLPTSTPSEEDKPAGTLSRESVKAGIKSVTPVFRACYQSALEDFPGAGGKVILDFDITAEDGRGKVSMSEVDDKKTTLFDNKLHDCMQETLAEVTFDSPDGGTVHVKYPFVFQPGSED